MGVCVCVCVCVYAHVWEREREGGREGERERVTAQHCVCARVWEREREGGGVCRHVERVKAQRCVCVCVCERGRHGHITTAACVQTHTSFINVCHATLFPSRDWTDGKTLHLFWKLKLAIMERGVRFPTRVCGVRPITTHCASWPIRADCAYRMEGLCSKQSVWKMRGIEDLQ